MPGLSFLLKKRFHPGRLDQQERVWLKETNATAKKDKEVAKEEERLKEAELYRYEEMMQKEGKE